jgi:hypothetical protein
MCLHVQFVPEALRSRDAPVSVHDDKWVRAGQRGSDHLGVI